MENAFGKKPSSTFQAIDSPKGYLQKDIFTEGAFKTQIALPVFLLNLLH